MRFTRKNAWLLIGIGLWTAYCWITFAKNLSQAPGRGEHHDHAYYVVHTVLIVINVIVALVLLGLGYKALKGADREGSTSS